MEQSLQRRDLVDSRNSRPTRSIQVVLQPASRDQQLEIVAKRAGLKLGLHLDSSWAVTGCVTLSKSCNLSVCSPVK